MKVLVLSNNNGHNYKDPQAWLIEVSDNTDLDVIHDIELTQTGVHRMGGSWKRAFDDAGATYRILSEGYRSHYEKEQYDLSYTVTSGNY